MHETLRLARERGDVLSALMPFRASYYEHFGYGLVERRCDWTVPLSVLPSGGIRGRSLLRAGRSGRADPLPPAARRARASATSSARRPCGTGAEAGRGRLRRGGPPASARPGECVSDTDAPGRPPLAPRPVRGWAYFRHAHEAGKDVLRVAEIFYEDAPALLRLLHFLASLRDQYAAAVLPLPADLPLNRLLRETQLPHRPGEPRDGRVPAVHPDAGAGAGLQAADRADAPAAAVPRRPRRSRSTRRPKATAGPKARVTRFRLDLADGRAQVTPGRRRAGRRAPPLSSSAATRPGRPSPAATCPPRPPSGSGLAQDPAGRRRCWTPSPQGPAPFCGEYF